MFGPGQGPAQQPGPEGHGARQRQGGTQQTQGPGGGPAGSLDDAQQPIARHHVRRGVQGEGEADQGEREGDQEE